VEEASSWKGRQDENQGETGQRREVHSRAPGGYCACGKGVVEKYNSVRWHVKVSGKQGNRGFIGRGSPFNFTKREKTANRTVFQGGPEGL